MLVSIVAFVIGKIVNILEEFWIKWLLNKFDIFTRGDFIGILIFCASILLTVISFLVIGHLLGLKSIRRVLNFLSKHIPLFSYFWSDEDELQKFTPVLFQNPTEGEYKIGFITGEQAMDNGKNFWRVYFFTGVGDHEMIDKKRQDLLIPLANPTPEILKLIGSFMTSGPPMLRVKKDLLPPTKKE